jgi:galactokinase
MSLGPSDLALMAQRAENDFVGCRCGNMDQLISAHGRPGHAVLIDCRSLDLQAVPLPAHASVVVIDSKVQRGLVDSEYNTRRQQCEAAARHLGVLALRDADEALLDSRGTGLDAVTRARARHVITENARTLQAAQALRQGDLKTMGHLMAASHRSMRDDFQITVPPVDHIVDLVSDEIGEEGGLRMTGGGFGGCVVALVPHARVDAVRARLARDYRSPLGEAAAVYACQAQGGAGEVSWD